MILTEALVALGVLGVIVGAFWMMLNGTGRMNSYFLLRQKCVVAAQAQMDALAATGQVFSDEEVERLWPGIAVEVTEEAGEGDWQGLVRRTVVAKTTKGKSQFVELRRYVKESAQ